MSTSGWRERLGFVRPEGDATEQAEQKQLLQHEWLLLMARQRKRTPIPVFLSSLVIVAMAGHGGAWLWPGAWLLLMVGTLVLRYQVLGRLPEMPGMALTRRVQWAVGMNLLNGVVLAVSLGFGADFSDYERMVQIVLLLGMCAGSVASSGGHVFCFLCFLAPIVAATCLAWLTGFGGVHPVRWQDWLLSVLMLCFGFLLTRLAAEVYRVFSESVLIRRQQLHSNRQLLQALRQTEQAMQAKTRFLASASHDLRQPMHTLTLLGATLLRRRMDEDSRRIVNNMNLAIESLSTQMDALLDISKLDAEVVHVNPRLLNLGQWLGRLHQEFLPAAHRKRLELTLTAPQMACVETDPVLLERVVRNLIDNAIKYTQAGQVSIVLDRRGEMWRLSIRDTGVGIAEDEKHRIFEEFYQVGNKERNRERGLGLGLSIVSRLVDLMDVNLELASTAGLGSCFTLSFEAVDDRVAECQAAGPHGRNLQGLRVLVLDDEEMVRVAMHALLSEWGCEVDCVGTTREALLKCMRHVPDIALVDYRLRGTDDGLSAIRSLRNAAPGLPALLISGDTAPERLRDAQTAGLRLLHKPLTTDVLIAAIREELASGHAAPIPVASVAL